MLEVTAFDIEVGHTTRIEGRIGIKSLMAVVLLTRFPGLDVDDGAAY